MTPEWVAFEILHQRAPLIFERNPKPTYISNKKIFKIHLLDVIRDVEQLLA